MLNIFKLISVFCVFWVYEKSILIGAEEEFEIYYSEYLGVCESLLVHPEKIDFSYMNSNFEFRFIVFGNGVPTAYSFYINNRGEGVMLKRELLKGGVFVESFEIAKDQIAFLDVNGIFNLQSKPIVNDGHHGEDEEDSTKIIIIINTHLRDKPKIVYRDTSNKYLMEKSIADFITYAESMSNK